MAVMDPYERECLCASPSAQRARGVACCVQCTAWRVRAWSSASESIANAPHAISVVCSLIEAVMLRRHQLMLQVEKESHVRKRAQTDAARKEQQQSACSIASSVCNCTWGSVKCGMCGLDERAGQKVVELENCLNSLQNKMLVMEKSERPWLLTVADCCWHVAGMLLACCIHSAAYEAKDAECKELKATCAEVTKRKKMFEDMYKAATGRAPPVCGQYFACPLPGRFFSERSAV